MNRLPKYLRRAYAGMWMLLCISPRWLVLLALVLAVAVNKADARAAWAFVQTAARMGSNGDTGYFPSGYYGGRCIGLSAIGGSIAVNAAATARYTPHALHASIKSVETTGLSNPYKRLESRWTLKHANGTAVTDSEGLTNPVSGAAYNPYTDQVGPEFCAVIRNAGDYVLYCDLRGWVPGTGFVEEQLEQAVTITARTETIYYVDADGGSDAHSAAQAQNQATPWQTLAAVHNANILASANRTVLLKRGTTAAYTSNVATGATINLQDGVTNLRVGAYGTGSTPIVRATTGNGTVATIRMRGHNHVVQDVEVDADGVSPRAIFFESANINRLIDNVTVYGATTEGIGSDSTGNGVCCWNVTNTQVAGQGYGLFMGGNGRLWCCLMGGSIAGDGDDITLAHHAYISNISNTLVDCVSFGAAVERNFCVNGNCSSTAGQKTEYWNVRNCDVTGTKNGLDFSSGNNDPTGQGHFNDVVVERNDIHAGQIGAEFNGIYTANAERIAIRDNNFYNNVLAMLTFHAAAVRAIIEFDIQRNNVYCTDSRILDLSGSAVAGSTVLGNVFHHTASVGSTGDRIIWYDDDTTTYVTVDYNQYYAPSLIISSAVKAWRNTTSGTDKTFAEWQAAGFDENGSYAEPDWRDPANGDFVEGDAPVFARAYAYLTPAPSITTAIHIRFTDASPPLTESPHHTNFIVKANGVQQTTASISRSDPLEYDLLLSETILLPSDVITLDYEHADDPPVEDAVGNDLAEFTDEPVQNYILRPRITLSLSGSLSLGL